jgi:putative endonuclease
LNNLRKGSLPEGSSSEREKLASARNRMAIAYILKSVKDGKYYYGSTEDLETRLKAHNAGKVKSTKGRRPLVLHFKEEFPTKREARQRELFFKSIAGYSWLKAKEIL